MAKDTIIWAQLQNGKNNHYTFNKGLVFNTYKEPKTQHNGNK